jgi:hypothetical protein
MKASNLIQRFSGNDTAGVHMRQNSSSLPQGKLVADIFTGTQAVLNY